MQGAAPVRADRTLFCAGLPCAQLMHMREACSFMSRFWQSGACGQTHGPQVHLLAACHARDIPVLCAGGAGAKADPTRLRVCDIADASADPLVRSVRHQLRVKHGIKRGVAVLLSTERPRCGLVTTDEQAAAENLHDYQVCCARCLPYRLGQRRQARRMPCGVLHLSAVVAEPP